MAHRRAHIVVGLGFGDEGKGATVDYLTRLTGAKLIVRYNGGAQAAHNVVTPDGVHHTFAQFGSGMLCGDPQVKTFLSRHMVIHPLTLIQEAEHLHSVGVFKPLDRLMIDERALIITPYHQIANQLRETVRAENRHGSCGLGVGETVSDAEQGLCIYAGDLHNVATVVKKLSMIREVKSELFKNITFPSFRDDLLHLLRSHSFINETAYKLQAIAKRLCIYSWYQVKDLFNDVDDVIFEGAQGTLLDEKWGFYPHTTWSNCTTGNAIDLLEKEIEWEGKITTYGVTRAYGTRHGPGPFPTFSARLSMEFDEAEGHGFTEHNVAEIWQGAFKRGWFDAVLARYAQAVNKQSHWKLHPIDKLVITHLDRVANRKTVKFCNSYTTDPGLLHYKYGCVYQVLKNEPSLQSMEAIGKLLTRDLPIYEEIETSKLVARIEEALHLKADLLSFGPTWKDRKEIQ